MREGLPLAKLRAVYGRVAGRYDWQHALITGKTDQKGRRLLVERAVHAGDNILDCGAGTGLTGIMAARRVGPDGHVTMFDLSAEMLAVARQKATAEDLLACVSFQVGDMAHLPFADDRFDVVLSTYSLCPLYDPARGARELLRVTRPGGLIAVAHSIEPTNAVLRWLGDRIESLAWHFPGLSMGCRSVHVLPVLRDAGCDIVFEKRIGIPLWPFFVFLARKPPMSQS